MSLQDGKVRISPFGRFRVAGPNGEDITPRGNKLHALLALMICATNWRRSRTWLQDKLWSDVDHEKGSTSLRQALSKIRGAFGDEFKDALISDRQAAYLDESKVTIEVPEVYDPVSAEFLEGIDIDDSEFSDWLSEMRSRCEDGAIPVFKSKASAPPLIYERANRRASIIIMPATETAGRLRNLESRFIDFAATSIREMFSTDLLFDIPTEAAGDHLLTTVQAFEMSSNELGIRTTLEALETKRALWSASTLKEVTPAETLETADFLPLSYSLISALSDAMSRNYNTPTGVGCSNRLAARALQSMFSMRHDGLTEADALFAQASEIEQRGVFDAWRAQLATIRFVERHGGSRAELREQSQEFSARAMQADPMNSNVLAAVANSKLVLDGDLIASGEMAKLAVNINPANPLAWWALANAQLYADQHETAFSAAKRAQALSINSPLRFWSDFQVSLIAAATNRIDEAIAYGELSGSLSANFRPPLRYLIALYAQRGDRMSAQRVVERLKKLEPDFDLDRLANDTAYPVSMMRSSGLIDRARLLDLDD